MTTLEILKAARELLSDEKRWTKGHYARDAQQRPTPPHAVDAVCWCPEGAMAKFSAASEDGTVNSIQVDEPLFFAFQAVNKAVFGKGQTLTDRIHTWNDASERTHAEVLQRFDDAIARQQDVTVPS